MRAKGFLTTAAKFAHTNAKEAIGTIAISIATLAVMSAGSASAENIVDHTMHAAQPQATYTHHISNPIPPR